MESSLLREGERLDDLQRDGLKLIQNPSWFCFGMDAVLLSAFVQIRKGQRCLDLGCGNGIIPILLAGKTEGEHFAGLEIQEDIAEMARRSVCYNHLENKVIIETGDIKEATSIWGAASFDVVTSNPPYLIRHHGLTNEVDHKAIARHELCCTLEDVVGSAAELCKPGGHFYMVHRPFRLAEIICCMVEHKLEPKRMRLVYPYVDKEPNMVLIEGVRGGNARITVEKPLIVYEKENVYTEEVKRLYYE
ncbi:MAG: tRNA1(Val) (adenine(37)-N6)-methyltransferase [Lachnospiraceae bacterium]|nr:tRNA1(Val) (adenine(37)-N6)-methyltransferase [Lachnospiraceae bacterium]